MITSIVIFLFIALVVVRAYVDPYKTLGLKKRRDLTKLEVQRAYRKQCITFHPDKNSSPKAKEEFIKVSWAKERVLKDIEREDGGDSFQTVFFATIAGVIFVGALWVIAGPAIAGLAHKAITHMNALNHLPMLFTGLGVKLSTLF